MQWRNPCLDFRLAVLECISVGKTSLVKRYCEGAFPDEVCPTVGCGYTTRTFSYHEAEVTLNFWDTAGQERFKAVVPVVVRGAQALVLVDDRTNLQSFAGLDEYLRLFREKAGCNRAMPVPILLLGNKSDSGGVQVPNEKVKAWAEDNGVAFSHYVSAKTGQGMEAALGDIVEALVRMAAMVKATQLPPPISNASPERSCC
jgi:small GTP-binding protein